MTAQNARLRRCGAALLCLVCAAVMVRSAFVGLEIDEEYALSLGFRLVSGDRLFYSMWEPHQLSSLPSAALLAAFMAVTGGTTGVLLFFRLVVLVCKAAMSCLPLCPSGFWGRITPASSSIGRRRRFCACTIM